MRSTVPRTAEDLIKYLKKELNDTVFQDILTYSEYSFVALKAYQMNSIGQVSGNLSICQNNITNNFDRLLEVANYLEDQLFAEAVIKMYNILKTIEPLVFSCYYMSFEY